jgi:phage/plasmid-associated DNA primase
MTMNDLPAFSDHARALSPRMNVIYYPNSYVGVEDRGLKPKLESEAKAGKLINWALRGLKDLRCRGKFCEPTSSLEILDAMELASSPVMGFVKECCELTGQVTKAEVYGAWCGWCNSQGRQPGQRDQFGRWLINVCPKVKAARVRDPKTGERDYFYLGLKLNNMAKKVYLK